MGTLGFGGQKVQDLVKYLRVLGSGLRVDKFLMASKGNEERTPIVTWPCKIPKARCLELVIIPSWPIVPG